jgi:hypothetical protein
MEGRTAISTRIAAHVRANVIGYAALLLALTLAPAWAIGGSTADGPKAAASGSVAKQVKKLKRRLARVERKLAALQAESGSPRPPKGAAGGDLTGSYPNPLIAANAVGTAEVEDGSIGIADLAGAARGARAYGRVAANGVLSLGRTKGVASVNHPLTGVYCITPAASINPDTAVLVVAPDFTGSSTDTGAEDFPVVQWRSSNSAFCPAGRLEVWTFVYDGDPTDDDDGGGNSTGDDLDIDNQPFTFVVP